MMIHGRQTPAYSVGFVVCSFIGDGRRKPQLPVNSVSSRALRFYAESFYLLFGGLAWRFTVRQEEEMHIGNRIKEVMRQQGRTVSWMAFQIHCERTNVYNIYKRKTIDTGLLAQICLILGHNFFADLAEEIRRKRHEKTEM